MTEKPAAVRAKPEKKSKQIKTIKGWGRGGRREGAGRKPGSQNRVTKELGQAARAYCASALKTLHDISTKGRSESARVAAAVALLDRGFGKPRQALDIAPDGAAELSLSVSQARQRLADKLDRLLETRKANGVAIEPTSVEPVSQGN